MTRKWVKIQGKLDLVLVGGEFELFKFELLGSYCIETQGQIRTIQIFVDTMALVHTGT